MDRAPLRRSKGESTKCLLLRHEARDGEAEIAVALQLQVVPWDDPLHAIAPSASILPCTRITPLSEITSTNGRLQLEFTRLRALSRLSVGVSVGSMTSSSTHRSCSMTFIAARPAPITRIQYIKAYTCEFTSAVIKSPGMPRTWVAGCHHIPKDPSEAIFLEFAGELTKGVPASLTSLPHYVQRSTLSAFHFSPICPCLHISLRHAAVA
jgi:hypothetical protein